MNPIQFISRFVVPHSEESLEERQQKEVKEELSELLMMQNGLRTKFDLETDEDQLEVYIYEMEAMEARIRACIRKAKNIRIVPQTDVKVVPACAVISQ